MSDNLPSPQPIVSKRQLALIVYILYFIGYLPFLVGMTALIGVIIAHIEVGEADALLRTHYQFQIRTFWIGLLYLMVGGLLSLVIIGYPILVWWFVWSVVRNVKGVLALNEGRPIAKPQSWLFG